jgi:hypothetical protein
MRYLIAAMLVLVAVPAAAQRLDTRRAAIPGWAGACRFPSFPGLVLDTKNGAAVWETPAREGSPVSQIMLLQRGKGTTLVPISIGVRDDSHDFRGIEKGRIQIDGVVIGASLVPMPYLEEMIMDAGLYPPRREAEWSVDWPATETGQLLQTGRTLDLIIYDDSDAIIYRSHWDLGTVRRIGGVLERVNWSCTGPAPK